MRAFQTTLLDNCSVASDWKLLKFDWPVELPQPLPGQFFTIRSPSLSQEGSGLLRRPLAFAGFSPRNALDKETNKGERAVYALYQLRGAATQALGSLVPEATANASQNLLVDILGPLGKGFSSPPTQTGLSRGAESSPGALREPLSDRPLYLLAGGGIGIGPVLYLASSLRDQGLLPDRDFLLVLGFRSSAAIPHFDAVPAFARLMDIAHIYTDDGSAGLRGSVLDGLRTLCGTRRTLPPLPYALRACGPGPMLRALADWALSNAIDAELSAEQWMACGLGACYGCVLPAMAGGYKRACTEGPVFAAGDIRWKDCP